MAWAGRTAVAPLNVTSTAPCARVGTLTVPALPGAVASGVNVRTVLALVLPALSLEVNVASPPAGVPAPLVQEYVLEV